MKKTAEESIQLELSSVNGASDYKRSDKEWKLNLGFII